MAVEAAEVVVVHGAQLHPRHVFDAQRRPVSVSAQHDVAELLRTDQPTLCLHIHLDLLIVGNWTCADAADRRLDILALDGLDDVGWGKIEASQARRVEPDPHRVIEPTEQFGLPYARRARQLIKHIDDRKIGDEKRVVFAAFVIEIHELQYRGRFLLDLDSLQLDLLRQLRDDRLHAIVDIDRIDVGIGAEFETYGERIRAVIAARALHVDHLVDADDLGLQRLRHRRLEHLRGRARIPRGDLDLGRHDIGELRDRDPGEGQESPERDDDRDNDREPRSVNED